MIKGQEKLAVLAILLLGLMLLGTECEEEIETVKITPSSVTLAVGQSQQFTAEGYDRTGKWIEQKDFSWTVTSTDTTSTVGTISDYGLFTATGKGACQVVAYYAETLLSAPATVTVTQTLEGIEITPSSVTVDVGSTQQFTATGKDTYNNEVADFIPSWSLTDLTVPNLGTITVDTDDNKIATFEAVKAGSGKIKATSGSAIASASLTVQSVLEYVTVDGGNGEGVHFSVPQEGTAIVTAYGYDADDNRLSITPTFTWTLTTNLGYIDETAINTGKFTAGTAAMTGTITASTTIGDVTKSGTVSVTVTKKLGSIEISPTEATVDVGSTQQFTGTGKDVGGSDMDESLVFTWSRSPTTLGSITSSGLFTADGTTYGGGEVIATSGSVSASVPIIVQQTLAAVTIYGPSGYGVPITVAQVGTAELIVYANDYSGTEITGIAATWTAPSTGTTSLGGIEPDTTDANKATFTASTTAGTGTITATVTVAGESKNGTISVTISEGDLDTIEIKPSSATVYQDKSDGFTATGKDANNNEITIDPAPTWTLSSIEGDLTVSDDNMGATFTASGSKGQGSIVATSTSEDGVVSSGSASITVKQVLISIAIAAGSYGPGQALYTNTTDTTDPATITITASGYDLRGGSMDELTPYWTSTVGSIEPTAGTNTATFTPGSYTGTGKITAGEEVYTDAGTKGTDKTAEIDVYIE